VGVNVWLVSDTHFSHANILNFKRSDGSPMRRFSDVQEMDQFMIDQWNAVVRPQDHVYHLGDVAIRLHGTTVVGSLLVPEGLDVVKCLNGHKRLVRGNHDIFKTKEYIKRGFEEIWGVRIFDDLILSHIPLHPESVKKRWLANVHGHVHNNVPPDHFGPKYFNVCVEYTDYQPVALESVRKAIREGRFTV